MHRPWRRAGHDSIHEDHIVIRAPSLDERERIPSVNFGFEPQVPKPLRDQHAGLIISAMTIPAANNLRFDDLHIDDLHTIEPDQTSISHASRSICSFKKWVAQEMQGS